MDKNGASALGKRQAGSIKEAIGKVTGDRRAQAEGAAQKAAGTVCAAADNAKGAARDAVRR